MFSVQKSNLLQLFSYSLEANYFITNMYFQKCLLCHLAGFFLNADISVTFYCSEFTEYIYIKRNFQQCLLLNIQ